MYSTCKSRSAPQTSAGDFPSSSLTCKERNMWLPGLTMHITGKRNRLTRKFWIIYVTDTGLYWIIGPGEVKNCRLQVNRTLDLLYKLAGNTIRSLISTTHVFTIQNINLGCSRSQWPRGLMRRPSAERLLRSWVRIPRGARRFVSCTVFVLWGRGLCDETIPRPEESYQLWCVFECDQMKSQTLDTYCEQVGRRGRNYETKLRLQQ
jgi:hypothetical protein